MLVLLNLIYNNFKNISIKKIFFSRICPKEEFLKKPKGELGVVLFGKGMEKLWKGSKKSKDKKKKSKKKKKKKGKKKKNKKKKKKRKKKKD